MVDGGGLENRCTRKGTRGSNPFPSANRRRRVNSLREPGSSQRAGRAARARRARAASAGHPRGQGSSRAGQGGVCQRAARLRPPRHAAATRSGPDEPNTVGRARAASLDGLRAAPQPVARAARPLPRRDIPLGGIVRAGEARGSMDDSGARDRRGRRGRTCARMVLAPPCGRARRVGTASYRPAGAPASRHAVRAAATGRHSSPPARSRDDEAGVAPRDGRRQERARARVARGRPPSYRRRPDDRSSCR